MSGSRGDRRVEGEQGDHKNTLPFVRRVLGQVRLYGERERVGEGGKMDRDRETNIVDK